MSSWCLGLGFAHLSTGIGDAPGVGEASMSSRLLASLQPQKSEQVQQRMSSERVSLCIKKSSNFERRTAHVLPSALGLGMKKWMGQNRRKLVTNLLENFDGADAVIRVNKCSPVMRTLEDGDTIEAAESGGKYPPIFIRLAHFYGVTPDRLALALIYSFCQHPPRNLILIERAEVPQESSCLEQTKSLETIPGI